MKTYFQIRSALLLPLSLGLAALAGCGGGDSGSNMVNPPPVASSSISDANADSAAATAHTASVSLMGLGSLSGDLDQTSVSQLGMLANASARNVVRIAASAVGGAPSTAALSSTQTEPCANGGSMTVTANVAGNGSIGAGDSLSFSYANCNNGAGQVLNGGFTANFTSVSGDLANGTGKLGFGMSFSNYSVKDSLGSYSANGAMNFSLTQTSTIATTLTATTSNIGFRAADTAGNTLRSITYSNASLTIQDDGSVTSSVLNETITVTSGKLNGRLVLSTPTAIKSSNTGGYPASGQVKMVADSGGLLLTYLGGDSARIDIDSNNDGTIDSTKTVKLSYLETL